MDSRIALGLNPLVLPDPAEPLQKALTIQSLMGQRDAQDLQLQQGQHSFRKQLAIENALKGATSDEDVISRLMPLDPGAAIKLRADQWKARKDQTDATQKATEIGSQMVSSFLALPDSEKPAQYPILVQQWNQLGIHPINPEPWSPALIPGMQRIAAGGLAPKEGVARMDLSGNGDIKPTSPAVNALTTPTPLQTDVNNGLTNTSQSIPIVKGMQNSVANALAQANQPDDYVGTPLPPPPDGQIPSPVRVDAPVPVPGSKNPAVAALTPQTTAPVEVTGQNSNPTPDSLRAQAEQLRATRRPANLDLAKELETAANNLDSRQMEQQKIDREKLKPVSNVPGAYFNQVTGEFTMDGKPVSAAKMQEIANAHSKAGAVNINMQTYEKQLSKQDAESVGAARVDAEKASNSASQIGLIRDLLKGYAGGPWSEMQATMGKYLPGTEFADATSANQIAKSIQVKLATQSRAIGSGSTSDMEMKAFMESIPSLLTTERGRDAMATIAERMADRAAIAADIKDKMVRNDTYTVQGYRKEVKNELIRQFGDKFLTDDEMKLIRPDSAKTQQSNAQTNSKGWVLHTDANGNKAFVSPDGKQYEEVR
jgi:hypothetical protein